MSEDELVEGRVRRGRSLIVGALGVALLGALPFVFGLLALDRESEESDRAGPTVEAPSPASTPPALTGRLVYFAPEPGRAGPQRLWVLDLETGSVDEGPAVPMTARRTYAMYAVGPNRGWLLLVRLGPQSGAFLLRDLSADTRPTEVARGDFVVPSVDGRELLVADVDAGRIPGCPYPAYRLRRIALASGRTAPVYRGRLPCGDLFAVAQYGSAPVVSIMRRDRLGALDVYLVASDGPTQLFHGPFAFISSGPSLFLIDYSIRPYILVWPGAGAPRPLVSGSDVVGRFLATSSDGRYVALDGTVDEEIGLWLLDASAGTVRLDRDALPPRSRTFGAAFDDDGTLFVVGSEGIVAAQGGAVRSVPLPSGAPEPRGAVVWLP